MRIETANLLNAEPRLPVRQISPGARNRPGCKARGAGVLSKAARSSGKISRAPGQALEPDARPVRQGGIVCGTDFSVHAGEAADVAAMLAGKLEVGLTLAHVVAPERGQTGYSRSQAMLRLRGRNKLKQEAGRLRAGGIAVKEAFLSGSPAVELVKAALQQKAGLIVVSSLGEDVPPARWLIGSVAEQTAHLSSAPVLVVRDPRPFRDWAAGNQPLNILVAHDFSASADAALTWAATLSALEPCHLTVAHLSTPRVAGDWLELGGAPAPARRWGEVRQLLREDLEQRCKGTLGDTKFQSEVIRVRDSVGARLVSLAKARRADLIVVGSNQKGALRRLYLGSVSRTVLREAAISTACVPIRHNPEGR